MSKYKRGIVKDIAEKHKFEEEQQNLKKKYQLDTEKIVVEKNNTFKFLIGVLGSLVRTVAQIVICAMAVIGIMTLIYPGPRAALIEVLYEIYQSILAYTPI